jgi:putative SOS response-associated peptidase YedK
MCYSAQIKSDYLRFVRQTGATIDLREFFRIFWQRSADPKVKVPKAVEGPFATPASEQEREIKELIDAFSQVEAARIEQELFKQRKRLADAERALAEKTTKVATESRRIATEKVQWCLGKLAALRRSELIDEDSRIFPGWYAPVLVVENGQRVIKPMRYQCRLPGKPAFHDAKFVGTYNARRDSLGRFWKPLFGHHHGILAVDRFYENVQRDGKNVVLEFEPRVGQEMLVACLWSRWVGPDGEELLSFAAITDEPPPEVAAAGHDRCIVPIKAANLDEWLRPEPNNLAASYAILDDRERPYYEHRLAA